MKAEFIGLQHIDAVWPLIAERLVKCIQRFPMDCSSGDLWMMCRNGHALLMIAADETEIKSASIWRYETWPDGLVFKNIILVGEDMESWLPICADLAREKAVEGGCQRFVFEAREGFKAIYPKAKILRQVYMMEVQADG